MFLNIFVALLSIHVSQAQEFDENDLFNISKANWTTCEQFVANTVFDPESVLDIDWKIFYIWNMVNDRGYHIRFSKPTSMLLEKFQEVLHKSQPPVNLSEADLFIETSVDVSGLFVRTKLSGKYKFIPSFLVSLSPATMDDFIHFGMKMVDGILGLVSCEVQCGYALLPADKIPSEDKLEEEAKKIHFWNPYGKTYLAKEKRKTYVVPTTSTIDFDDAEDDMQIEIDQAKDAFPMF